MDIKRGYVLVAITFALIILSGNFAVAAWTEGLNDNLVAYYNFNQSGGLDSVNGYNLAEYNIDYSQGIQGNSAHFDDHTNLDGSPGNPISDQISFFNRSGSYLDFNESDFSFNLWLNHTSNKTFTLLTSDSSSPSFGCLNQGGHVGGNFYFYNGWFFSSDIDCKEYTNDWVMLTITKNSSSLCIWTNGNLNSNNCYPLENDSFFINGPVTMGGVFSPTYQGLYDGLLDEFGIWNRSLTQSEVSQLYNSGNGITYTDDFTTPAPTEWTEELNDNLIAYWGLNSTGGDDTGNGNNFSVYGTSLVSGKVENGRYVSGNGGMNISPNNFQFENRSYTINVWINLTGNLGDYHDFVTHWNPAGGGGYYLTYSKDYQKIYFQWCDGVNYPVLFSDVVVNNAWYMITVRRNSTSTSLWINNVQVAEETDNLMIANWTGDLYVGKGNRPYGLDGVIDELGIWNRDLTNNEIEQLYNNGNGITYTNDFQNEIPANQSGFWTLNGTNLYTSNSSYKVGIGTSIPSTALEVIGEILASDDVCISGGICLSDLSGINFANFALLNSVNTFLENQIFDEGITVNGNANISGNLYLKNKSLQLGTQDAYGRNQIWNFLPNSVLRLGSLGSDGDAQTVSSEGIVVYGKNVQGDNMSSPNFGYARIKSDRIGLYTSRNNTADYYFRVDSTSLYLKNDSFGKTFEVIKETGLVSTQTGYSVNGQIGITNNTGFWMCKDSNCSTTCQVDIRGGIIVGCA